MDTSLDGWLTLAELKAQLMHNPAVRKAGREGLSVRFMFGGNLFHDWPDVYVTRRLLEFELTRHALRRIVCHVARNNGVELEPDEELEIANAAFPVRERAPEPVPGASLKAHVPQLENPILQVVDQQSGAIRLHLPPSQEANPNLSFYLRHPSGVGLHPVGLQLEGHVLVGRVPDSMFSVLVTACERYFGSPS